MTTPIDNSKPPRKCGIDAYAIHDVAALQKLCAGLLHSVDVYRDTKAKLEAQLKEAHESCKRKAARLEDAEKKYQEAISLRLDTDLKYGRKIKEYRDLMQRFYRQDSTIRALQEEIERYKRHLTIMEERVKTISYEKYEKEKEAEKFRNASGWLEGRLTETEQRLSVYEKL